MGHFAEASALASVSLVMIRLPVCVIVNTVTVFPITLVIGHACPVTLIGVLSICQSAICILSFLTEPEKFFFLSKTDILID